ncbi:hypothetical protein Tco_0089428 [Tanacetum coccineum]
MSWLRITKSYLWTLRVSRQTSEQRLAIKDNSSADHFNEHVPSSLESIITSSRFLESTTPSQICKILRVISSIHGKEGAMNRVVGSASRVAKVGGWNDFVKVGGIDETGIEFKSLFAKKVGNGDSTSFMVDLWSGVMDSNERRRCWCRVRVSGYGVVLESQEAEWKVS